jgi:hypothetical protein
MRLSPVISSLFFSFFFLCIPSILYYFFFIKQGSQNLRIPNSEVVGDHFSSLNMEIKKNRDSPHKDKIALFELRFLQIQAEKFSVYCYLWCR